MLPLDGRVAIVTGGGTGIGRAIAEGLARAGADVVVAGRRPAPLEDAAAAIRALGRRALAVPTDVTLSDERRRLVEATLAEFGQVDILVNNAGASRGATFNRGPLLELTEEDFDGVFDLNVKSVFLLSQAVARSMIARGKGVILVVASMAGRESYSVTPGLGLYAPAKAALNKLSLCMAREWGPQVRVICLNPGVVATEISSVRNNPALEAETASQTALGRVGQPEDFAGVAAFLASDAASWISGIAIDIHGGARFAMPETWALRPLPPTEAPLTERDRGEG
jgi:NAD(P)-dependent dehydrogenase (short-subunit alcohol dehydrogenase family)